MRILIIDDEFLILDSISDFLTINNYATLTAQSVDEAYNLLKEYDDISLIILDINFPKSSGVKFLKDIRRDYPWLPVLVISANREEEVIERLKDLGISGFMQKPINPQVLLNKIRDVLRQ